MTRARRVAIALGVGIPVIVLAIIVGLILIQPSGQLGPNLPVRIASETYSGTPERIDGTLAVEKDGCFSVVEHGVHTFLIWPPGYAQSDATVIAAGGRKLDGGTQLRGTATRLNYPAFIASHGGSQGRWDSVAGYCLRSGAVTATSILAIDTLR